MVEKNNNTVSDPVHTSAILERIKKNHYQLEIKKADTNKTVTPIGISEILDINYTDNTILFDTLNHDAVTNELPIKIFTKYDGVKINFNVKIIQLTIRNHLVYFKTNIPKEIIYKQRRLQYRVKLQNLWKIPVTLLDNNIKTPLTAYIYNISTGGINVRSSTDKLSDIKEGVVINTLIQLPNMRNLKCKLQIRQTSSEATTGLQQLAGKFINLSPQQEKSIQSFVNSVERNNIKIMTEQQT